MDITLAVKTGPDPEACVPVVGLPFADYDRVAEEIALETTLRIEPVSDNPHDPLAIEVWYDGVAKPARIGFVPRDFTRALRLALDLGEITKEVRVIREGGLAFGVPADMLVAFLKVTAPAVSRAGRDENEEQAEPREDHWGRPYLAYHGITDAASIRRAGNQLAEELGFEIDPRPWAAEEMQAIYEDLAIDDSGDDAYLSDGMHITSSGKLV